ncbi:salicylate hydroxylase [Geosmithia morbida]|uniref:Salicylate hydroxylase n=1 Tax=Geosmithia morbida TaxID=1094350 RepID=A0A9P4YMH7_9HYPO|nr:salicylate hydroxylase [Geosmithia morbida]KAF4119295.1 salicylate hydroxylase [Geosmithia morbida]
MTTPKRVGEGIRVAIIGGGPAGLSAAIELGRLDFVDWRLYEQKPTISEIGTGLSLQQNTWHLLEKLGASKHLKADDFFRPGDGNGHQCRDGISGVIVKQLRLPSKVPPHRAPCRVHRGRLQRALLKEADASRIRTGKKLKTIDHTAEGKVQLTFQDGFSDTVDLLIGADGIRSVVQQFAFPGYSAKYTGSTGYRTTVRVSEAERINGMTKSTVFWFGDNGGWLYTTPLDGTDWEVTARVREPDDGDRSSWGREVPVDDMKVKFTSYCEPVRQLLDLVTRVKRYDHFGGRRLPSVVQQGSVALIGDASHPLSGAFGAGAAFALEDSHVLAGALKWAASSSDSPAGHRSLADALRLYDDVRSPHYVNLYKTLDNMGETVTKVLQSATSHEEQIVGRVNAFSDDANDWMYYYDVSLSVPARWLSSLGPPSGSFLSLSLSLSKRGL